MPNESPFDSTRSVTFNIDVSEAISENAFQVGLDTLKLVLDSGYEIEMIDEDNNDTYSCTILDLIFGKTYDYGYSINGIMETLDGERSFTVYDSENIISDYYGELNPTILTFLVDMSHQINEGNFDPSMQFLDVAGTFNDWSGSQLVLSGGSIYTTTVTNIEVGSTIEFKFRIDGSWETSEFPGYGSNRSHEIQQGDNTLEFWYNDEGGE
jgi:hypothetical protein